ncbi:MAG: hypothetical protein IKC82_06800 [Lentisphaeria bacterium]|nr:hypothetical protein [Lentisphaeria bacterium]
MKSFEENFREVPPLNTPAYFWFICFEMDLDELLAQLHDMYDHGARNVCLHPVPQKWRPGSYLSTEMSPDYLTEEYFVIIRRLVQECEKLGIHYYLYDEGGWPSGGACGKVLQKHPEWKRQWIVPDGSGGTRIEEEAANPEKAMLPDLLHPGATGEFIAVTHENYRQHLPEYIGETVKIAFMDEPAIAVSSDCRLTWTADFAVEFRRRKGYDIIPYIPELLKPSTLMDSGKLVDVRVDFHDVRTQLFIERFMLPIRDWCRKNGMLSGGHFDGEDTPELSCRRTYGSVMRSLRCMDVPGVDVIWRQIWPEAREHSFPRFASSAAHLEGNTYSLGELFGVYGNGLTPESLRYIVDYFFIHGINLLVFGSYPQRNAKNWLAGCRPHFGPDDPLWQYFDEFHIYVSRASFLLSSGKPLRTTALVFDDRAVWADNHEKLSFSYWCETTAKRLRERRILFDYVDDDILGQGVVSDGELIVGAMRYRELVVPVSRRLSPAAEAKIAEFVSAGGVVTDSADIPEEVVKLTPDYPKLWMECRQLDDGRQIWFFFHSGQGDIQPQITLPGASSVVTADPVSGEFYRIKQSDDGSFVWHFGKYDTAFFITNMKLEKYVADEPVFKNAVFLTDHWQLQPLKKHSVGDECLDICVCNGSVIPAATGDWRKYLGDDFSGNACYMTDFEWRGDAPGKIYLDLGKVNYCCQVSLNGSDAGKKFRGPFVFDISDKLNPGSNHLEVTVTNTLANAYSPREVELKMQEKWQRSGYEDRQRSYELDSLESGLFGPVMLKF